MVAGRDGELDRRRDAEDAGGRLRGERVGAGGQARREGAVAIARKPDDLMTGIIGEDELGAHHGARVALARHGLRRFDGAGRPGDCATANLVGRPTWRGRAAGKNEPDEDGREEFQHVRLTTIQDVRFRSTTNDQASGSAINDRRVACLGSCQPAHNVTRRESFSLLPSHHPHYYLRPGRSARRTGTSATTNPAKGS